MKRTKTALFLPFLQTITGHHHVADVLMDEFKKKNNDLVCEKVDILSYSYGQLERVVTAIYLMWIKLLPTVYHFVYLFNVYRQPVKKKRHFVYELLFSYHFKRLINEKAPAILFCTHALPSNIASTLKQKRQCTAIIVNVYTDYFINRVWGIDGVDYHFVPTITVKKFLLSLGVDEERIFITGIPIHSVFTEKEREPTNRLANFSVLVTGGTLGIGKMKKLLVESSLKVDYHVLCGKNEHLYRTLLHEDKPNITPYRYILSSEMNTLYDRVDGVITKPGGVTITECLIKRKPIFLLEALPGQERINAEQLKQLGLVIPINNRDDFIEEQILHYFKDEGQQKQYKINLEVFHHHLEASPLTKLLNQLAL